MSTTTLDRNEAFNAERRELIASLENKRADALERARSYNAKIDERIASGKLVPIGNGQFRVNDPGSWDNNEVFTYRRISLDMPALLLPQSNLDMSTGKAALYTRKPEWHDLGNVVPEGIVDIPGVLAAGGIDFEVAQTETLFQPDPYLLPRVVPDSFVNYRTDTGAPLGVVGNRYTPIQNASAAAWLQDLIERYGLVFESAGATFGGAHVFVGMMLPEDLMLDLGDGVTDTIKQYLYWRNTHDGTGKAKIIVTPWRVVCGNTERFALRDAAASWGVPHTTNALSEENLKEARRTLGLTVKYFDAFKMEEEALARTEMELRAFEELAVELYPKPGADEPVRTRNNWDRRMGDLTSYFKGQAAETGLTAYSAERAFTDWADHAAPKRVEGDKMAAARATAIIEGENDAIKTKVHKLLMTRAA